MLCPASISRACLNGVRALISRADESGMFVVFA
jgi:hypothetical protein